VTREINDGCWRALLASQRAWVLSGARVAVSPQSRIRDGTPTIGESLLSFTVQPDCACERAVLFSLLRRIQMPSTTGAQTAWRLAFSSSCSRRARASITNRPTSFQRRGMAPITDPNLKNPGTHRSATVPGGGEQQLGHLDSLYRSGRSSHQWDGTVLVPPPGFAPNAQSAPTGVVFNGSPRTSWLHGGGGAFHLRHEDGTISAGQREERGAGSGQLGRRLRECAVYKGATSAEIDGRRFLYVTNFRSAKVESTTRNSSAYT